MSDLLVDQAEFADGESFKTMGEVKRVFLETKRNLSLRINSALRNVRSRAVKRERRFSRPRLAGTFTGTERIDCERGLFAILTLSEWF